MAENIQRSTGRGQGYKFDRGGMAAEMGPFIGVVKNNIDPTRQGRLQVYIKEFAGENESDPTLWRTVRYLPHFYGITEQTGTAAGTGAFAPGNRHTYGMWFTPPDIDVRVMCFFPGGDPNQGYYIGCLPEPGFNHMIPAIGSSDKYQPQNKNQETYFANSSKLPVTEINELNQATNENPRFFDQAKPVHSVVAAVMFQQGLNEDLVRGPIASNSQRESPSNCYGIITPGQPIYQGGLDPATIRSQLEAGTIKPQDVKVIGRQGGHSMVMDDGDLEGTDQLIRIRTSKGHQITMSDDGNCFYIIHANGQAWIELGQEGTVDVFATNSVNVRTNGTINFHADKDINMFAGGKINVKSTQEMTLESQTQIIQTALDKVTVYCKNEIGIRADGSLAVKSKEGSWNAGSKMVLRAGRIDLNGGSAKDVPAPSELPIYQLDDTEFDTSTGWQVVPGGLETIVTRAPTHEPYPYHNQGVDVQVDFEQGQPSPPPAAPPVPEGWSFTAK